MTSCDILNSSRKCVHGILAIAIVVQIWFSLVVVSFLIAYKCVELESVTLWQS